MDQLKWDRVIQVEVNGMKVQKMVLSEGESSGPGGNDYIRLF